MVFGERVLRLKIFSIELKFCYVVLCGIIVRKLVLNELLIIEKIVVNICNNLNILKLY